MKVGYTNSGFPPDKGGIPIYSYQLMTNVANNDQIEEVSVIAFKNSNPRQEKILDNMYAETHGHMSPIKMGFYIGRFMWRHRHYDIFHATNIFPVGFWTLFFARLLNKKCFLSIYGTDVLTTQGSKKTFLIKKWILANMNKTITISNSTHEKTIEKYKLPENKFIMIHECLDPIVETEVDKMDVRALHNLDADDFVVLSVCNLVKRKGVDDIIRAVVGLNNPQIKLIVVGKGPEKEFLENLVKELKAENKIIFAGRVPSTVPYYKASNVFVIASYYDKEDGDIEGQGTVVMEAQQLKVPIIGTNSGGIPEGILADKTGFLVAERDIKAIQAKIMFLYDHPDFAKQMGEAGRQFILENFDWQNNVKIFIKTYQEN